MASLARHAPAGTFRLYLPLMDQLAQRGVRPGSFLEGLGFPEEWLREPDSRVQRSEEEAIWRHAIEVTGDPLLPARAAQEFPPEAFGVIVYLARASSDGPEAVRRVRSYLPLLQGHGDLALDLEPGLAVIRLVHPDGYRPELPVCEYRAALHVFIGRSASAGRREPRELRIVHPEPPHATELERFLGVPLRYGAEANAVAYPRAEFDRPLAGADEGLSALLEGYARELLDRLPNPRSFADRVRAAVLPRLSRGSPGIEAVAAELRMSARTVRRHLREEGTSYRDTLDALRRELALRALERGDVSVDAIALDLGYSDASAFHKAFRRWTGHSPAAWAARHGA